MSPLHPLISLSFVHVKIILYLAEKIILVSPNYFINISDLQSHIYVIIEIHLYETYSTTTTMNWLLPLYWHIGATIMHIYMHRYTCAQCKV